MWWGVVDVVGCAKRARTWMWWGVVDVVGYAKWASTLCVVRGAWCVVRGAWCVVPGAWCVADVADAVDVGGTQQGCGADAAAVVRRGKQREKRRVQARWLVSGEQQRGRVPSSYARTNPHPLRRGRDART